MPENAMIPMILNLYILLVSLVSANINAGGCYKEPVITNDPGSQKEVPTVSPRIQQSPEASTPNPNPPPQIHPIEENQNNLQLTNPPVPPTGDRSKNPQAPQQVPQTAFPEGTEEYVRPLSNSKKWTLHVMPRTSTDNGSCQGQQRGTRKAVMNSGSNCYLGNRVIMMPLVRGFLDSIELKSSTNEYILADFQNHRIFEHSRIVDYAMSSMVVEFRDFMSFDVWHNNVAYNGKQTMRYLLDSVFKMGKVNFIVSGQNQALVFQVKSLEDPILVFHETRLSMLQPSHRVLFVGVNVKAKTVAFKDAHGAMHRMMISHQAAVLLANSDFLPSLKTRLPAIPSTA